MSLGCGRMREKIIESVFTGNREEYKICLRLQKKELKISKKHFFIW